MKKLSISILLLFVMILSITAVAAADDVTSDLAKSQVDDSAALAVDDGTDVLAAAGDNFTTVQGLIDSAAAGDSVVLNGEYKKVSTDKNIVVDKELTITGGTLDADTFGGIFNVTKNGKLTLLGVTLKHGNATDGGAIYNDGDVILKNVIFADSTNGSTIYNNGNLNVAFSSAAVQFDSGSQYAIYNKGTVTSIDQADLTDCNIFNNNGTIENIVNAKIKGIENNGTIGAINVATPIATINNNGTITSMKGKYGTVTNKGTIETIDNVTLTGKLSTQGAIATVKNSTFDGVLEILTNGSIGTINNVTALAFDTYGNTDYIINSTFTNYFWCENENVTIGTIYNVSTNGKLHIDGEVYAIVYSKLNERIEVSPNGTIGTIYDVTATALDNYGDIIDVYNSIFTSYIWNENENATIDTLYNVTTNGKFYNGGSIDEIYMVKASSLENLGEIGAVIYANITGEVTNKGNISEIDDSIFGAAFTNDGNIDGYGIENLTVVGVFMNNGNITDIEASIFNNQLVNNGNITSIEDTTFKSGLGNSIDGNISTIENATFINAGIYNVGNIGLVSSSDFNASGIANQGNITVALSSFYGVDVPAAIFTNAPDANATISLSVFANNTAMAIDNEGNLGISLTSFKNNTNLNVDSGRGIVNSKGNLTIALSAFDSNVANVAGAIYSTGNLTVNTVDFNNNTAKMGGAIINAAGVAKVENSIFTNNTATMANAYKIAYGNAIYNEGNLTLSGNTINDKLADVYNEGGFVTAVKITVTNDGTVYNYAEPVNLTATLTDDNGNWIYDMDAIEFVINGTNLGAPTVYNNTTGVYLLTVTLDGKDNITNADQTVTANLTAKYANATADITNGTLKTIKGTFTELQYLVNKTAAAGTLVLPYNFAYNAEFDNVNLTKGVVINKAITINGNGTTIDGKGAARIFFINTTGTDVAELKNITFTNGAANNGAAICLNTSARLRVYDSVFTNNVATEKGGAIYSNGTFVNVLNSKFTNNTANGAANAIYVNAGMLNLNNNTINKNVAEIVNYNGTLNYVTINATVLENKTLNITYGESVTLKAVITDENGNLINDHLFLFVVNNEDIPAIFDAESNLYTFENNMYLKPGLYNVTVRYNSTTSKATLNIKNATLNVSKEAAVIVIFTKDVVAGQNATIELMAFGANGDDLNGTNVTVTVNNVPYNVTIINGTGNITLPVLDLGTYHVYANWAGDENHNASSQVAEFGVKIATVMTISATNAGYDSALIKVTLTDGAGNKLSKFVKVYVADGVYEVAVKNGEGTQLVTGLKPGAYIADAEFSNDAEYADASAQTTFTVQPAQIVVTDMKRGWNSPYDYYATLLDAKGNPVAGKEITFTIDGVTYKATTNASGIATVAAKLDVGTHTVTVTNPDTGANSTATTTIVERIQGYGNITKDYLGPESYIVQVFGDDGNPVGENVVVEVRFAGKTYEMLTNASGYIVRTINFVPGFYAVYSVYAGYQTIQTAIVVNQILKVSAVTVKKSAKSFKLTATLKSSDGKAISGKEIKFTFAGKTYKAKTNSNGVATYKLGSAVIKKLKAGKKYTYKATYVNDIVKGKITVKK